jgi:hypothetical protein
MIKAKMQPNGVLQVGHWNKTSAFVLLSSAVPVDATLSANEQIINFFILLSANGWAGDSSNSGSGKP